MTGEPGDLSARRRAVDVTRSVIVQAPAGSGKTSLLVERYLRLLSIVNEPEEILAITFTRKAAEEMRTRIGSALQQARADVQADVRSEPARRALARSDERGWDLETVPGRLRIQTIDSFALALGRGLPVASGYDPGLRPTELATDLYQAAADQLLGRLYTPHPLAAEIADFLLECGNDAERARRLLVTMLGKRDQWLSAVAAVAGGDRAAVADALEAGTARLTREVIDAFARELDDGLEAELNELTAHAAGALGVVSRDDADRSRFMAGLFTTGSGTLRRQLDRRQGFGADRPEIRARARQVLDRLAAAGLEERLADLRALPDAQRSPEVVERLVTSAVVLVLANAELETVFRQRRRCDFSTLTLNAERALGDPLAPTELALALDYRIHHLLVDEFQDTSAAQFRLFERLLAGWAPDDGNTFFAVGDPMQSIYRFRDADVGLFLRAWQHGIGDVTLERVRLTTNFRAAAELVDWANGAFETLMGERDEPLTGRVAFRAAHPARQRGHTGVSLTLAETTAGQIDAAVEHVERCLAQTEGSVAVLVRSRGQLERLTARLRERRIDWTASDIEALGDTAVVADLLSLVAILDDPEDRLAWFAVLRSPLVGLTLMDLQRLAESPSLGRALAEPPAGLSGSGRERLGRLADAWQHSIPHRGELPPRSVLENLWLRLGGTDAYEEPAALAHATRFLELVDELGWDGRSAAAVERAIAGLYAEDVRSCRLSIMTIHRAKGLEFDHVVVPFLERSVQADDPELLLWRPISEGLLLGLRGADGVHDWLARENRLRNENEQRRLLYVAATRARESLAWFATPGRRGSAASLLSLFEPLMEAPERHGLTLKRIGDTPADESDAGGLPEPHRPLRRLRDGYRWQRPTHLPVFRARPDATRAADADPLADRPEVVLGLLVHAELERLASTGLPADPEAYVEGRRDAWRAAAASYPLADGVLPEVLAEAARQIRNVLSDANGRWLLTRTDGQAELPVSAVRDGAIAHLVLDRTFVSDGRRWVVDYKTTRPGDADTDGFVRRETGRYRAQLELYGATARALFHEPVQTAIYFTAIPRLVPL